jgi:hypothetical protein
LPVSSNSKNIRRRNHFVTVLAARLSKKTALRAQAKETLANKYLFVVDGSCGQVAEISLRAIESRWSLGCVSAVDSQGRTIWIADAHRGDGKGFVVRPDKKLTAFIELESGDSGLTREGDGHIASRTNRATIENSS